jgi:hypothetical protein
MTDCGCELRKFMSGRLKATKVSWKLNTSANGRVQQGRSGSGSGHKLLYFNRLRFI